MKKDFIIGALIVMAIIFVVGIILIFSSLSIGQNEGFVAMHNNGGTMDTSRYERIINTTILNYQIVGAILSLIGGIGVLLSGYLMAKK